MKMKKSKLLSLAMVLATVLALGSLASCEESPDMQRRTTDPNGVWDCRYVLYSKTECEVGDWTTEYKQEHEYLDHVFVPWQIRGAKVVRFGFHGLIGESYYGGGGKRFLPYTIKTVGNPSGVYMVSGDRLTHMYDGRYYVPEIYYEGYCNKFPEIEAIYKANVVYDINYENEYKYHCVDNYEYGSLIEIIPPDPEREGYKFDGWYKEAECVNKWDYEKDTLPAEILDEEGNTVFQETALYAKWISNDDFEEGEPKPEPKPDDNEPIEKPVPTVEAPLGTTVLEYAGEINVELKAEQEGFYVIELPKTLKVERSADLIKHMDKQTFVYVKYFQENEALALNLSGEYASNLEISFLAVTDDIFGAMDEGGRIAPSDKVRAFTITNSTEEEANLIFYSVFVENNAARFGVYGRYNALNNGVTIAKDRCEYSFTVFSGQTACVVLGSGGIGYEYKKSNERYEWYLDGERIYGNKLYLKQENKTYDLRVKQVADGVTVNENCVLYCEYTDVFANNQLNVYGCEAGTEVRISLRWYASETLKVYILPPKVDINLSKDENGIWLTASVKDKDDSLVYCDYKIYLRDNDTGNIIVLDSKNGAKYRLYDKTELSTVHKINVSAVSYTMSISSIGGVSIPQPLTDVINCEL